MSDEHNAFSRGQSCALGKCTAEVKLHLPEELDEQLSGMAVLNGQTKSEYIRTVLLEVVYGRLHAMKMAYHGRQGRPG